MTSSCTVESKISNLDYYVSRILLCLERYFLDLVLIAEREILLGECGLINHDLWGSRLYCPCLVNLLA